MTEAYGSALIGRICVCRAHQCSRELGGRRWTLDRLGSRSWRCGGPRRRMTSVRTG